jgi:hypothetical protein
MVAALHVGPPPSAQGQPPPWRGFQLPASYAATLRMSRWNSASAATSPTCPASAAYTPAQIRPLRAQQPVARYRTHTRQRRFHQAPPHLQLDERDQAERIRRLRGQTRLVGPLAVRAGHLGGSQRADPAVGPPPGVDDGPAQRLGQALGEQTQPRLAAQRVGVGVAPGGKRRGFG